MKRYITLGIILCVLLASCTFPVTTSDDFDIHFGRPATGDVIMLGESMELLANGSSASGDVTRVLYFANGSLVGTRPNSYGSSIVADYSWTPAEAGLYTLQLAAQRRGATAYSHTVQVCVLPFQIAPDHPSDTYAHGYNGDCTIPDRSGSAAPGDPTMDASANPTTLTYIPDYFDLCPDETRVVAFNVTVTDPPDSVVFAAIALQVDPALASRINSETTLALTQTDAAPPNTKTFSGTLDMHIFLARSLTESATSTGESGNLNWTARAFGRDGAILIESGPFSIPAEPVNCSGESLLPSLEPIIVVPPAATATPASAQDCPPGTYFAEITHKCIPVQIQPTKSGGGSACSGITSDTVCNATSGCSFDYNAKKCVKK